MQQTLILCCSLSLFNISGASLDSTSRDKSCLHQIIAIPKFPSDADKFSHWPKLFISVSWYLGAEKTPSFFEIVVLPKARFPFSV